MKSFNFVATLTLATITVALLSACGAKKNGSSNKIGACTMNAYGQMTYANGQPCTSGTMICPTTGYYQTPYGQMQQCVPGQYVNNGTYPQYPGQYPYNPYPQQGQGCMQWTYTYGVQYVPVMMNGTYQCVRYDLVNQYAYNTPYYNNYDYYYAYPPYTGGGCNNMVAFGGSYGSVGVCWQ